MRPEMWAVTTWPFSSFTRNTVLGSVSRIVPSNSMESSLDMLRFRMWSTTQVANDATDGIFSQKRVRSEVAELAGGPIAECARPWPSPALRGLERGKKVQELASRQQASTEADQVGVFQLGVDQRPFPAFQQGREACQRNLGTARLGAEHALAAKHPAHRHAIDATDQARAIEHFDAVRVAESVQFAIGVEHFRHDPGAVALAAARRMGTGLDHFPEAGVGAQRPGGFAQ